MFSHNNQIAASAEKPPTDGVWHTGEVARVLEELEAEASGLSADEARVRLDIYGPNRLPEKKPPTIFEIFLRQFYNPLMYILLVAAAAALTIGDVKDAVFIAIAVLINAVIGTQQEYTAERSTISLRKLLRISATVLRDGEIVSIPAEEVVPGDVIWLESGNRVPADARLLENHELQIDESLLTGESLAVHKDAGWQGEEAAPVGDRLNMAFAGSIVVRGRGRAVVVSTGSHTMVGQLALDVVGTVSGRSPLLSRMEKFTKVVAVLTFGIAGLIGVVGVWVGYSPVEMLMFAIALAVSAIPEGLPVAMTVALAVAMTRMARRNVIVRRLAAVEGLGSCTLVATDKTGTLTVNELTVREVLLASGTRLTVTGEGFSPHGLVMRDDMPISTGTLPELDRLVRSAVLCNEGHLHPREGGVEFHGDAVDIALLALGHKLGWQRELLMQQYPQVGAIPFESELQYAATFHEAEPAGCVCVKGSPERILSLCEDSTDAVWNEEWLSAATELAERGYRVLALAEGGSRLVHGHTPEEPQSLTFLGLVGMIDPLRAGVKDAVQLCRSAGVEVAMVTGDHKITALAIARELGLAKYESEVVTGTELAEKSGDDLVEAVRGTRVFARVAPRQKLEIVEAAQAAGHFVAVTGDGANDAPALRKANIGVAMGRSGTDVARETAELVLSDDNFASIVAGIDEGRIAYDNIRKVIILLLSTGATELLIMFLAISFGMPLPLIPLQLLWLNLVTNGIQHIALAFEPGEGDTLRRRPRSPDEGIFNQLMIERLLVSSIVMAVVGFGAFYWMIENGWEEKSARNSLLLLMVLFENFHLGNCRSETKSAFAFSPLRSPTLLLGAVGAFLIHFAAMHIPFIQNVLETHPIPLNVWLVLIPLAVLIVPAVEFHKLTWYLRNRKTSRAMTAVR